MWPTMFVIAIDWRSAKVFFSLFQSIGKSNLTIRSASPGALDNPSGQCLPLEDNVDLLNVLNFTKGCYLGQELVARTHYTGVVRKRLMPIEVVRFEGRPVVDGQTSGLKEKVQFGISLTKEDNPKKRLGKIRSISSGSNLGLALLYHKDLESCKYLAANQELGLLVKVNKPIWWPAQLN